MGQIVQDHHIPRLELRYQLGLDIGVKGGTVYRAVQNPRRDQAIASKPGNECLRPPVAKGAVAFRR